MNKAPAAKRHRLIALACLVVTTAATAPVVMDWYSVEPRADEPVAFAQAPFEELLLLRSDASETVPLTLLSNAELGDVAPASLGYLANDRSADRAIESFAGGPVAGNDAALAINPPAISGGAMPTIGGYAGAAPITAAAPSGALSSAIGRAALPRMLAQPAGRPGVVVAELGRKKTTDLRDGGARADVGVQNSPDLTAAEITSAQGSGSNAGSGTQVEASANLFDNILLASAPLGPTGPLIPDVEHSKDPNPVASPSAPLSLDVGQRLSDPAPLPILAADVGQPLSDSAPLPILAADVGQPLSDSAPLPIFAAASGGDAQSPFGAPTTPASFAPLQAEIPEPATVALLGLGLAAIGFSRRRR